MRFLDAREVTAKQVAEKLVRDRSRTDQAFASAGMIVDAIRCGGDAALLEATQRIDGVRPDPLVSKEVAS